MMMILTGLCSCHGSLVERGGGRCDLLMFLAFGSRANAMLGRCSVTYNEVKEKDRENAGDMKLVSTYRDLSILPKVASACSKNP